MIQEHTDEINKIISDLSVPKSSKVIIIDADSLSYICS